MSFLRNGLLEFPKVDSYTVKLAVFRPTSLLDDALKVSYIQIGSQTVSLLEPRKVSPFIGFLFYIMQNYILSDCVRSTIEDILKNISG